MSAASEITAAAPAIIERAEHRVHHTKKMMERLHRFGAALRKIRADRTQGSVAKAIGVSVNQYSNMERGVNWPSLPVYLKLCEYHDLAVPPLMK